MGLTLLTMNVVRSSWEAGLKGHVKITQESTEVNSYGGYQALRDTMEPTISSKRGEEDDIAEN
jgi:hypothetical protein